MNRKTTLYLMRLGLACLLALLPAQTAFALGSIRHVKAGGRASGDCLTWATACDLQYALSTKAVAGDQVWVRQGVYRPGSARTDSFVLKDGIALYGGFAGTEALLTQRDPATRLTVLSGDIGLSNNPIDNSYHVVVSDDTVTATAVLDGFTITAGNANDPIDGTRRWGAGMENRGSPTLKNLVFSGNVAVDTGGGMINLNGGPALTNVTFAGNSSGQSGGGIYNVSSSPVLTRVVFDGNTAGASGGGLYNSAGSPTIQNVVFSRNRSGTGGGLMTLGGSPKLTHVRFSGNRATWGGGMYNEVGSPTLAASTFVSNSADYGGGLYIDAGSTILTGMSFKSNRAGTLGGAIYSQNFAGTVTTTTLARSTFSGNVADSGGGIYLTGNTIDNDTITIRDVAFSGNAATGGVASSGGGVYNGGTMHLSRATFTGNTAQGIGGGLLNAVGMAVLANVTFSGNAAGDSGGAIYNYGSSPQLNNVTVSKNRAGTSGGGMSNELDSHPVIRNSVFWGNGAEEFHNFDTSTVSLSYSVLKGPCPLAMACSNVVHTNPLLAPLANNGGFTRTMALQIGSSALDKGNACEPKDQRDISRPQGLRCDIGAYEFVP